MLTHRTPPDFRGGVRTRLDLLNRHTPSGPSRVDQVTQLRTDGVHCRESVGTGPVVLEVVLVTGAAFVGLSLLPVAPVAQRYLVPRNPLIRWDVSSIPVNEIFLTKKLKNKIKYPTGGERLNR